ncbi:MAG: DNA-protecting protein DprA [Desulfobacterales bacterium]|nr:DNA-protecting protein DprA [Desulfobacterales bacterium]
MFLYLPWFSLKSVPGIGNHIYKKLISKFKTPENVFNADVSEFIDITGIRKDSVKSIQKGIVESDSAKREIENAFNNNINIVTQNCDNYPTLLKEIPDPPPFIYVKGSLDKKSKNIAIVGSRNASSYGLSNSEKMAKDLTTIGFQIVSGMARGVDTRAHLGALSAKGKTVAVLGSGLLNIYPKENKKLFDQITENGAVISEYPLNMDPLPRNFPVRNRIISGISLGTVVIEAALKSGSLITARLAAEQNREVFAVPGNILSFKSSGTHSLIKQGAKLVENFNDILEEIPVSLIKIEDIEIKKNPDLENEQLNIYNLLDIYPIHIDEIIRKTSINPGKLSGILFKLELSGHIKQEAGNYFSISEEHSV